MSTISASTTSTTAYKVTADTTGTLVLQTGSSPTTAMTIGSNQLVSFTSNVSTAGVFAATTSVSAGYALRGIADSANTFAGIQFTNYAQTADWGYLRAYSQGTLSIIGSTASPSTLTLGIGTTTPDASYGLDVQQSARIKGTMYVGWVNGSTKGLWFTGSNYASPSVQAVTSAGNADNLLLNPAGGNTVIGGQSAVRQLTIAAGNETSWTPATTSQYWNISDSNGSNGGSYSIILRGLASGGTAQVNFSGFTIAANTTAVQTLSKTGGSFRIAHPLPQLNETHDLVHSFVESPDANNIYRGVAQLVDGVAVVNLDEVSRMTDGTYVALNRDSQPFVNNLTNWDAVKAGVEGNILTITCQNPNSTAKVSWLVIGMRHDPYMYATDWTDDQGYVITEPLKRENGESNLPQEGATE